MENKKMQSLESTGRNLASKPTAVEKPSVSLQWKYNKRGVLSFTTALLFIGTLVSIALGMMLISESNTTILAVIWLILGLVQLFAGIALIFVLQKTPFLPQEDRERLKKPTQIRKRIILSVEVLLCLLPFIFLSAERSFQMQSYANGLYEEVFGAKADDNYYITYTFEDKKTCIRREYDVSGYVPVILTEESLWYSVAGSVEAPKIQIDNTRYEVELISNQIKKFVGGSETFHELEESDVPVFVYSDFVSSYNDDVLGSINSITLDSDYIVAAKSALIQHSAIKYPETTKWYSSEVYAKDRYGRAIVYLEFTCENAFGVAQRYQEYVFIQEIKGDQYRVDTSCYYCGSEYLEIYKIFNDFGEHPNQEQYASILAEENLIANGEVRITAEQALVHYTCSTELVTIDLYADPVTDNLSAVKVTVNSGEYTNANTETRNMIMEATVSAVRQIKSAQVAELVNTGSFDFSADSLTNYLVTNKRVMDFVQGGLIINADVVDGKSVIAVVDGFRYSFTEEVYWTPLGETETGSLFCSQCGTDCSSSGLEEDGRCNDCHSTSTTAASTEFHKALDMTKVWQTEWTAQGAKFSALYVFEENGICYMVMDWNGYEAIGGGKGTYTVNGDSVTFSLVLNGSFSVSYVYTFDSANCTFTQISEAGLVSNHKQGDVFTLKENDSNTVDKIKSLSQYFNNTANSGSSGSASSSSSFGNSTGSGNTSGNGNTSGSGNASGGGNTSDIGSSSQQPAMCSHNYVNATCTSPKTCTLCGQTSGTELGHSYSAATCTTPQTCSICGTTVGTAAGHTWEDITETVYHEEQGHYEDVQDAKKVQMYQCWLCSHSQPKYASLDEYYAHFDSTHGNEPNSSFIRERYELVDVWVYETMTVWVVDRKAYTETVVAGRHCSVCGKDD